MKNLLLVSVIAFLAIGCIRDISYIYDYGTDPDSSIVDAAEEVDAGPIGVQGEQGQMGLPGPDGLGGPDVDAGDLDYARWVLRDKDGEPVNAVVGPGHEDFQELAFEWDHECVWVQYHEEHEGGTQLNILYDLKTGKITPDCYRAGPDEHKKRCTYLNSDCTGDCYSYGFSKIYIHGGLYYSEETDPITIEVDTDTDTDNQSAVYRWNTNKDPVVCEANIILSETYLYKYKPAPEWINNLLPNAPYTLKMEY